MLLAVVGKAALGAAGVRRSAPGRQPSQALSVAPAPLPSLTKRLFWVLDHGCWPETLDVPYISSEDDPLCANLPCSWPMRKDNK